MVLANNLSSVHICGKVTNCSLCLHICILCREILRDEGRSFLDLVRESAVICNHAAFEMCRKLLCVRSANWLSFNCFYSPLHSCQLLHLINVLTPFHMKCVSLFFFVLSERFVTPEQLFPIILFCSGCLPHHTSVLITVHKLDTLSVVTPHLSASLPLLRPLRNLSWSRAMRLMAMLFWT